MMALWNLAARDELAVQPASRHVADLLLAACNLYVDLTALQTAFMKQLRPFYSLYADAEHARRAEEVFFHERLGLMGGLGRMAAGGRQTCHGTVQ